MRIKPWLYVLLGLFVAALCLFLPAVVAVEPVAVRAIEAFNPSPEEQAQQLYEAGNWAAAIEILQRAVQQYQQQEKPLLAAVSLSNLALVYQQTGQWQTANQVMAQSLTQIERSIAGFDQQHILAQTLNIQARLQLAQGQAETALTTWQRATEIYQQLGDRTGEWQSQLNQAQALQTLGFYRRAVNLLTSLQTASESASPLLKATILRSLADALQVTGDMTQAQQVLDQAQQTLVQLGSTDRAAQVAATYLSQANLIRTAAVTQLHLSGLTPTDAIASLTAVAPPDLTGIVLQQRQKAVAQAFVQQTEAAIQLYQQAIQTGSHASIQTQAQLNLLQAQLDLQHWTAATTLATALPQQLNQLPIDQTSINQRLNLAMSWLKLQQATQNLTPDQVTPILQLLKTALQQAIDLQDLRTQSFAWGSLSEFWAVTQPAEPNAAQSEAIQAVQQALVLSQAINATDLTYRWQWQLGRLLQQPEAAISAYTEAVKSLQSLRNDLVSINRNVQFSFQAQVEPVYRELVSLLLPTDRPVPINHLVQARQVIEALQVAELDNFFREACLETQFQIDRVVDRSRIPAAIFYTIVLPDRLEVILKLPQQDLLHYTTKIDQTTIEATVEELLGELKRPYVSQRGQVLSQQVYDWLIRPAEAQLNTQSIQTLVFVLDGSFRSLPIAALSDGQQYLIQKYSVALAPGLQITDPNPLQRFNVLLAGLSEARANFSPLKHVLQEVNQIQEKLPSRVLLNQDFTQAKLQQQLDTKTFSIVHVATHGQFSSNAADTFILAWDQPINVNQLSDLLQAEAIEQLKPIELLVLSACRTAAGDRRAALGMAGMAVRAGARSTIASLWNVDDDSGAVLMNQFYQTLVQHPESKAAALQQAQQTLLADPQYAAPRFWAPYILLGNWL